MILIFWQISLTIKVQLQIQSLSRTLTLNYDNREESTPKGEKVTNSSKENIEEDILQGKEQIDHKLNDS